MKSNKKSQAKLMLAAMSLLALLLASPSLSRADNDNHPEEAGNNTHAEGTTGNHAENESENENENDSNNGAHEAGSHANGNETANHAEGTVAGNHTEVETEVETHAGATGSHVEENGATHATEVEASHAEEARTTANQAKEAKKNAEAKKAARAKKFGEGALVRTPDKKIFVIRDGEAKHVKTLTELKKFARQPIQEVNIEELATAETEAIHAPEVEATHAEEAETGTTVQAEATGAKVFREGALVRTPDKKIFVVRNGIPAHIRTLAALKQFARQPILEVDAEAVADAQAEAAHAPEAVEVEAPHAPEAVTTVTN